ncbi:MAG TPA: hypothetical protein VHP83_20045 [Aggregatilineaceae bacterium]|nr:hypothetical protein [Aggregatilineaceae bacterium]
MSDPLKPSVKSILTVDIAGYSLLPSETEMFYLFETLCNLLHQAMPEGIDYDEKRIWSPGGDGGSLTFSGITDAYKTAINLGKLTKDYNQNKPSDKPRLRLKMGLHADSVIDGRDFDERLNVWGHGINLACRIADAAKPGQILASDRYCEHLRLIDEVNKLPLKKGVTYIGRWWIKHGVPLQLYNINVDGAGIPISAFNEWYEPFKYPLEAAVEMYTSMLYDHYREPRQENVFRAILLCKMLLDLDPSNVVVLEVLQVISEASLQNSRFYHPIFSNWTKELIRLFLLKLNLMEVRTGEIIGSPDDDRGRILFVVFGGVQLSWEDGYERELKEGEVYVDYCQIPPHYRPQITASQKSVVLNFDLAHVNTIISQNENITDKEFWIPITKICEEQLVDVLANRDELLSRLSVTERRQLRRYVEIIPYGKHFNVKWEQCWVHFLCGGIKMYAYKYGDLFPIQYNEGECLGPVNLSLYNKLYALEKYFDLLDDTLIVAFPLDVMEQIASRNSDFRAGCEAYFDVQEEARWHYSVTRNEPSLLV